VKTENHQGIPVFEIAADGTLSKKKNANKNVSKIIVSSKFNETPFLNVITFSESEN